MSIASIEREHIDGDAQKVIRHLTRNGYQAYLVGGCVRDLLLGRTPKDFDVATSATPAEIRDMFRNCRIIGRRFRLAHIVFGRKIIETATFRANPHGELTAEEAPTEEGALYLHRDNVFGSAEEDAKRRDFTINGLFYEVETGEVIDYVGGLSDLAARHIRTIGDPRVRFLEDPVRIVRALKFAARLGFDIEDKTYQAMTANQGEILKSAPARVVEEVYRLLKGGAATESMYLLGEIGMLATLLPTLAAEMSRDPHALEVFLRVLDERTLAGEVPSNAALLALLVGPVVAPLFVDPEGTRDAAQILDDAIRPLAAQLRLARRDMERLRLMLAAQRRIWLARQRRGKLPPSLLGRDYGAEALALHALFYRAAALQQGRSLAESALDVAGWPLPQPLRLGDDPSVEPAPRGRPGRRRRGDAEADRLVDEAGDVAPVAGSRGSGAQRRGGSEKRDESGEQAAVSVDVEEAALAAYEAALQRDPSDDWVE